VLSRQREGREINLTKKLKFIEVTKRAIGCLNSDRRALQNKAAAENRQGFS
jgi:hypothetical protein